MTSGAPYLNSKISLVSKAQIRYEGILFNIDAENATVALAKVRSFGTEDRQVDRPVPPRDDLYEYIIFRGSDIEDLTVCEPPKQPMPPKAPALPQDPAIVQSVVTSQSSGLMPPHPPPHYIPPPYGAFGMPMPSYQQPHPIGHPPTGMPVSNATPQAQDSVKTSMPRRSTSPTMRQNAVANHRTSPTFEQGVQTGSARNSSLDNENSKTDHHQQVHNRERNYNNRGHFRGPNDGSNNYYRGSSRGRSRGRGSYRHHNKKPLTFDSDFDFESANAQFNKEDIAKELMDKLKVSTDKKREKGADNENIDGEQSEDNMDEKEEDDVVYYDKAKSFFDNISCETNNPKTERISWSEERKLNTETFGTTWRGRGRNYRGNRGHNRGRWNGYRGNRGGYGAGYNNHYNSDNGDGYRRNNWSRHQNNRNYRGGNRPWVNYEFKGYKNDHQQAQTSKKEVQPTSSS